MNTCRTMYFKTRKVTQYILNILEYRWPSALELIGEISRNVNRVARIILYGKIVNGVHAD